MPPFPNFIPGWLSFIIDICQNLYQKTYFKYLNRIKYNVLPDDIILTENNCSIRNNELNDIGFGFTKARINRKTNEHLSDEQYRYLAIMLDIRKDQDIYWYEFKEESIPLIKYLILSLYEGEKEYVLTSSYDENNRQTIKYENKEYQGVSNKSFYTFSIISITHQATFLIHSN